MTIEEAEKIIQQAEAGGPFKADWQSLKASTIPDWYQDAKFGIFIHWGVFSVPTFNNEWYSRNMYIQDSPEFQHHRQTYGSQTAFGYKDFIPLFTGKQFDPHAWAALFKQAGAKFVIPVAEHHDGFALYNCSFSPWNAVKMGPQRDVLGELATAIRQQDLTFGLSYHRAEHWWFFNGGRAFPSDVQDPRYRDFYGPARPEPEEHQPDKAFLDDWLARLCELVERYQPQQVYFDWWIEQPAFRVYLPRFAAYYYNRSRQWQREVVITYKNQAFPQGTAVFDVERGQMSEISPRCWQACTSISYTSWCYVTNQRYKTAASLIADMVDIVSKNGAMLLNVGPRADGTIPEQEADILLSIGRWLAVNGEAIYGTRPWKVFGEGPTEVAGGSFTEENRSAFTSQDIRFTTRGDILYATALAWPQHDEMVITSLAEGSSYYPLPIERVELLGSQQPISWVRSAQGLRVQLPKNRLWEYACTLKILAQR